MLIRYFNQFSIINDKKNFKFPTRYTYPPYGSTCNLALNMNLKCLLILLSNVGQLIDTQMTHMLIVIAPCCHTIYERSTPWIVCKLIVKWCDMWQKNVVIDNNLSSWICHIRYLFMNMLCKLFSISLKILLQINFQWT